METARRDFEDLFECLNRRRVKALIVGAHAVAFHAKPRYTKHVDVLVEPSVDDRTPAEYARTLQNSWSQSG